jgi:hypothetical protein
VDEFHIYVAGLLTPAPRQPRVTVSVDTIGLWRDTSGHVVDSKRLGPTPFDSEAVDGTVDLLRQIGEHAQQTCSELQSTVVDVRERRDPAGVVTRRTVQALARVETVGGPVLLGTSTSNMTVRLPFDELAELPAQIGTGVEFQDRPIVVRPSVAAVLIVGTVFSLTSANGRQIAQRMAGKRILPSITISVPAATLVDRGVMCSPAAEDLGQSMWDHDSRDYVTDPVTRAELSGNEAAYPDDALELVWCAEGLQRYHADGTVRLRCLARVAGSWFFVTLSGKPIHLLRHVTGVLGPPATVYTDSEVTTQSLVLASARTIEEKGHGRLTED